MLQGWLFPEAPQESGDAPVAPVPFRILDKKLCQPSKDIR
jgi:hypothetical protein